LFTPSNHIRRRACALIAGLTLGFATATATVSAAPEALRRAPMALVDQLHARAVQAFQSGRFPEAYGRFVALADAGHAASASQALWMCEHGLAKFGRDWDCAPHQVADWAVAAGISVPSLLTYDDMAPRQR